MYFTSGFLLLTVGKISFIRKTEKKGLSLSYTIFLASEEVKIDGFIIQAPKIKMLNFPVNRETANKILKEEKPVILLDSGKTNRYHYTMEAIGKISESSTFITILIHNSSLVCNCDSTSISTFSNFGATIDNKTLFSNTKNVSGNNNLYNRIAEIDNSTTFTISYPKVDEINGEDPTYSYYKEFYEIKPNGKIVLLRKEVVKSHLPVPKQEN